MSLLVRLIDWGLRDYGIPGQLGLEPTPEEYTARLVAVFREVWRVLRDDGTLWLNLGDSYVANGSNQVPQTKHHIGSGFDGPNRNGMTGLKPKDLVGIPWRVAFALQADGWYLRSDCIWHKPNPMPESVTDRPTKSHEYLFLLSKRERYFYDAEAVKEEAKQESYERYEYGFTTQAGKTGDPNNDAAYSVKATRQKDGQERFRDLHGRNRRTVWTYDEDEYMQFLNWKAAQQNGNALDVLSIATEPYPGAHFATYPTALVEPCIKAGSSERGCCPVCGAPWERVVERVPGERAKTLNPSREAIGHSKTARGYSSHQPGWRKLKPDEFKDGWTPGCNCHPAEPVPCTILDPFCGSATTLLVARSLGRNAVGLDLSMAYLRNEARERLSLNALDAWANGVRVEQGDNGYRDLPLWQGGIE